MPGSFPVYYKNLCRKVCTPGSTHNNNKSDLQAWVGGSRGWKRDVEGCVVNWPEIDWYYLRAATICWLFGSLHTMSAGRASRQPCCRASSTSVGTVSWEDRQAQELSPILQAHSWALQAKWFSRMVWFGLPNSALLATSLVLVFVGFFKGEMNEAETVQQKNAQKKKEDKIRASVTIGFFRDQQHAKPSFCSLKSNAP